MSRKWSKRKKARYAKHLAIQKSLAGLPPEQRAMYEHMAALKQEVMDARKSS